jgi:hypothetical protein
MRTLMTGPAGVHYGQISVESTENHADLGECFGGQRNGLCGAAIDGKLFLITGLHTGTVGFAVELYDDAPPLDDSWEEIVEASFRPLGRTMLTGWAGEWRHQLDLPLVDYRVRYCGWGMDAGHQGAPQLEDDDPLLDRYVLQFWPSSPAPDRVVKQTSGTAAYWHDFARTQPPPPTPQERAEAKRQADLAQERRSAELRLAEETRNWGGVLPTDRLRALSWSAIEIALRDRPLVDALDRLDAGTQRAIARWAARRAFVEAGLTAVDWIRAALDGMDRGDELPELFGDGGHAFQRMLNDDRIAKTTITTVDGRVDNFSQQSMALPALAGSYKEDPLAAAVECVRTGANTFGFGRERAFFAELRRAFPALNELAT